MYDSGGATCAVAGTVVNAPARRAPARRPPASITGYRMCVVLFPVARTGTRGQASRFSGLLWRCGQQSLDRVPDEGGLRHLLAGELDHRFGHRPAAEALVEPPARVVAQHPDEA